jgi:hypothetical protein
MAKPLHVPHPLNTRLGDESLEALKALADQTGLTKSVLIREIVNGDRSPLRPVQRPRRRQAQAGAATR